MRQVASNSIRPAKVIIGTGDDANQSVKNVRDLHFSQPFHTRMEVVMMLIGEKLTHIHV